MERREKNVRDGLGERKGSLSPSPYPQPPYPRFFSLRFPRSERLEQACVPQLVLGLLQGTRWSAIGQIFPFT